ncbi:hypothetical protein [Nonomuraea recticatena]|uniref:hypothetical protein n=1 Tax=Nonomuraea recticatena TaxID=46178 RepID=UPI00361BBAA4
MLITLWMIVGVLAGVSGVVIGYVALRQARAAVDDCQRMITRQAGESRATSRPSATSRSTATTRWRR